MITFAFEGLEGGGKSTATRQLISFMKNEYSELNNNRFEPLNVGTIGTCTESKYGHAVREALRQNATAEGSALTDKQQALLILTDRLINDTTVVSKHLSELNPYVYDRYIDSTLYLQGFSKQGGVGVYELITMMKTIDRKLIRAADITVILKADVQTLSSRLQQRQDLNDKDKEVLLNTQQQVSRFDQYLDLRKEIELPTHHLPKGELIVIDNPSRVPDVMLQLAFLCARCLYTVKANKKSQAEARYDFIHSVAAINEKLKVGDYD